MLLAIISGVVLGTMYGLFALGIVLVFRGTKVINFAAPALGSFGLHITYTLHEEQGVTWLAAAIIGVLVAGLIAVLFERFVVRRMGDAGTLSVAVATIGLMLLLFSIELYVWTGAGNTIGGPLDGVAFRAANVNVSQTQALGLVVALAMGLGLSQFLKRTDFGLGVQAAAMDADAVRLVGIRLNDVNVFVWSVGAMLAVIAALFAIPTIGAFAPGTVTGIFFIPALAAALIGGLDNLSGAFVGGLVVGLLTELSVYAFLGTSFAGSQHVTVFVSIVLVLLLAPKGVLHRVRELSAARSLDLATAGGKA